MLRTGERGPVYGEGDLASNELGGLDLEALGPSRRASTSLRSSSSIASIDIGWAIFKGWSGGSGTRSAFEIVGV